MAEGQVLTTGGGVVDVSAHKDILKQVAVSGGGENPITPAKITQSEILHLTAGGYPYVIGDAVYPIVIMNDGQMLPFGLHIVGGRFQLMATGRESVDDPPEFDGGIDFGTELGISTLEFRCVTEEGLTREQKYNKKKEISGYLNSLRSGQWLSYESNPDIKVYVRLSGRAELREYPTWVEVNFSLDIDPLWSDDDGKSHTGSGTLENEGSFEAPLIIEMSGAVAEPEVVVSGKVLKYDEPLSEGDCLVIDTGKMTVALNHYNALAKYEGDFPLLQPGETAVTAPSDGTTTFKWKDRWL